MPISTIKVQLAQETSDGLAFYVRGANHRSSVMAVVKDYIGRNYPSLQFDSEYDCQKLSDRWYVTVKRAGPTVSNARQNRSGASGLTDWEETALEKASIPESIKATIQRVAGTGMDSGAFRTHLKLLQSALRREPSPSERILLSVTIKKYAIKEQEKAEFLKSAISFGVLAVRDGWQRYEDFVANVSRALPDGARQFFISNAQRIYEAVRDHPDTKPELAAMMTPFKEIKPGDAFRHALPPGIKINPDDGKNTSAVKGAANEGSKEDAPLKRPKRSAVVAVLRIGEAAINRCSKFANHFGWNDNDSPSQKAASEPATIEESRAFAPIEFKHLTVMSTDYIINGADTAVKWTNKMAEMFGEGWKNVTQSDRDRLYIKGRELAAMPESERMENIHRTFETCANCGREIGKLETPRFWRDSVVCGECKRTLDADSEANRSGSRISLAAVDWVVIPLCLSASAMSFAGIGSHPYGFYTVLRYIVCGVSIFCAIRLCAKRPQGVPVWVVGILAAAFAALACIFNPLVPLHLEADTWKILDMSAGSWLGVFGIAVAVGACKGPARRSMMALGLLVLLGTSAVATNYLVGSVKIERAESLHLPRLTRPTRPRLE